MGQVLHGNATTKAAFRRAIQHSQANLGALATRYGINTPTVAKWRARTSFTDLATEPKTPASTVLTIDEEAVVVAFRRQTLLPLDNCLYALQPAIPYLTRSSLHRSLQRHGISRLPEIEGEASPKRKFRSHLIGFFHIDLAEVRTAAGRLYLLVAIDRTSKFAFVELHREAKQRNACDLRRRPAWAVPYKIHAVPADNAINFATPGAGGSATLLIAEALARGEPIWANPFEYACAQLGIEHRLIKPKHPCTSGQVERMNRTNKDATVRRCYYDAHEQIARYLADFVAAYTFDHRLKARRSLRPYEFICKQWTATPQRFSANQLHQLPGLNI